MQQVVTQGLHCTVIDFAVVVNAGRNFYGQCPAATLLQSRRQLAVNARLQSSPSVMMVVCVIETIPDSACHLLSLEHTSGEASCLEGKSQCETSITYPQAVLCTPLETETSIAATIRTIPLTVASSAAQSYETIMTVPLWTAHASTTHM
jgi:hypothetical protein